MGKTLLERIEAARLVTEHPYTAPRFMRGDLAPCTACGKAFAVHATAARTFTSKDNTGFVRS